MRARAQRHAARAARGACTEAAAAAARSERESREAQHAARAAASRDRAERAERLAALHRAAAARTHEDVTMTALASLANAPDQADRWLKQQLWASPEREMERKAEDMAAAHPGASLRAVLHYDAFMDEAEDFVDDFSALHGCAPKYVVRAYVRAK